MNSLAKEALKLPRGFASPHTAQACTALLSPGQLQDTEPGAISTSRKCGSHQNHTQTTLAQASTAWNANLIFQLISVINKSKLPEPDCRRVQAAEKGGTDPVAAEMNQETDPAYSPQSHQV